MTSIEIKNILIHKILEINDLSFLKAIKTILDSKTESEVLVLTPAQRDEIIASKKEIEKGLFEENEALEKELKKWLKEK